jgi:hypothetical protein
MPCLYCPLESEVLSLREGKLSLEGRVKALKVSLDKEQRATSATSARIQEVTTIHVTWADSREHMSHS